jgi:hypothetical protein
MPASPPGCKRRDDYEAGSVSRQKPWLEDGISRRTWYRRQQAKTHYAASGRVPHIARVQITVTSQW